uniref:Uncharacterized protein n=1 Tax=Panagrolaimus sp. JU765 TaxID=591449 RepID=A0AC34QKX9_9BILA
ALPSGQPVLGCARPTCFGWNADGFPAGSASTFYRVNRKPDGFFRKSSESPRAIPSKDATNFQPQLAQCASTFDSEQCPSDSQWVGGFGPLLNATNLPLAVQCCEYKPLSLSEDRGVAVVNAGQIVIGGEVLNGQRQYAFDYISDVIKHTSEDGKISYDVSIRRLPCLPYPPEFSIEVEESVKDEVLKRFSKTSRVQNRTLEKSVGVKKSKIHQAPTFNVADNEIINAGSQLASNSIQGSPPVQTGQVIEGPFVAENDAIIEEANAVPPGEQAIQGLELPEGQVPPNVVNPPADAGAGSSGYYPVNTGGSGGGWSSWLECGFFCFSSDTLVKLSTGDMKRMDELEIEDWILSADPDKMVYSRVESWIHKMPKTMAEFIKFTLENGKTLKITGKHFIFRGDCSNVGSNVSFEYANSDMVYADEIEQNHCLFVHENGQLIETRIHKIEHVKEQGIYAPMTSNTNIIVNDIHASCFNIIKNKEMQDSFSQHFSWWKNSFIGQLFGGEMIEEEFSEIELIPGMQTLVSLLMHIVPKF